MKRIVEILTSRILVAIYGMLAFGVSMNASSELIYASPEMRNSLESKSQFYFLFSFGCLIYIIICTIVKFIKKIKAKKSSNVAVNNIFSKVPEITKSLKINKYESQIFTIPRNALLWLDHQILHILMYDDKKSLSSIIHEELNLNDINYYFNSGVHYTENKISGGGGGGSTLGGAVVGGVLFGPVGAVIGSRKKVDSVTSKLLVHDTRETILKFTKGGSENFIHFRLDELKVLYGLIPSKNFDYVMREGEKQFSEVKSTNKDSDDLTNRLRRLKQMKDEGFLNDQEYEAKRQELIQAM